MGRYARLVLISCTMALLALLGLYGALGAPAIDAGGGSLKDRMDRLAAERLDPPYEALKALHRRLALPGRNDWLAQHHEPGQTVAAYRQSAPIRPAATLTTIYIQPVGDFTPSQERIVRLCADAMGRYFGVPVKLKDRLPLSVVPATARRVHPEWGMPQVLTSYVLDSLLAPQRPADALAYIAFTASDLWPGEGWNFVFGQASLRERVGVWSIYRNGNPDESPALFKLCLLRTIKTATHETGHILSIYHCLAYDCNMNGSNHRDESDSRPAALCPCCLCKLCWNTGRAPAEHLRQLAEFWQEQGFPAEAEFCRKSLAVVEAPGQHGPARTGTDAAKPK